MVTPHFGQVCSSSMREEIDEKLSGFGSLLSGFGSLLSGFFGAN
jgi:hypothetical protein